MSGVVPPKRSHTRAELNEWFDKHVFPRENKDIDMSSLVKWFVLNRCLCSDDVESTRLDEETTRKRRREHVEERLAYHEAETSKWIKRT
jgi:hypothetical protein